MPDLIEKLQRVQLLSLFTKNDNGLTDGWTDRKSDHFMTYTSLCRAIKNQNYKYDGILYY